MNSTLPFLAILLSTVLVAHLRLGLLAWTALSAIGLGAATMCIGLGQGIATIIERV